MVQIFHQEELSNIVFDLEDQNKWKDIVESLDMEGQKKLTANENPISFPALTQRQEAIMNAVCPNQSKVSDFEFGVIPLEVLETYKRCKEENQFHEYEIRYNRGTADPFLIGLIKRNPEDKWSPSDKFLIARWGDDKLDWEKLYEKAKKELMREWKAKLESRISRCKNQLESLDAQVTQKLEGEWINCEG